MPGAVAIMAGTRRGRGDNGRDQPVAINGWDLPVRVQADLMMALVAVIRDLLREFLSKSLGEKPR